MHVTKIYGPPGTGKTTRLLAILDQLIASGTPPRRIAYLTHTTAAANEVKSRLPNFDKKDFHWFRTIHSACCSKLGISKTDIVDRDDYRRFSEQSGFECTGNLDDIETREDDDLNYDILLHLRSVASNKMISIDEAVPFVQDVPALASRAAFFAAFDAFKSQIGKLDFVDMIEHYTQLKGSAPLPVDVVIIDEAQDLSKLQWQAIDFFCRDAKNVYIAGDDDQSIYAFLGADEFGFLDRPCDEKIVLTKSYRCGAEIGRTAEGIIGKLSRREVKHIDWPSHESRVHIDNTAIDYYPWEEWSRAGTTMVLVRHRRQILRIKDILNDRGISYSVNNRSIATAPIAEVVRSYIALRSGEGISAGQALRLYNQLKINSTDIRAIARKSRGVQFFKKDLEVKYPQDWPSYLGRFAAERRDLDTLRNMLNTEGLAVIGRVPSIDISTYHGSKGREADRVVLVTDCYRAVWDEQEENPDGEIRLAYVGLTRARKEAIIVWPETQMYMRPLID